MVQYNRHISTSTLNEIIQEAVRWKEPPSLKKAKQGKIYYCTQIADQPPTIAIFVNDPDLFSDSYRKYIEGQFRNALDFRGTAIKIIWTFRR
jgi:GTP-binding protein